MYWYTQFKKYSAPIIANKDIPVCMTLTKTGIMTDPPILSLIEYHPPFNEPLRMMEINPSLASPLMPEHSIIQQGYRSCLYDEIEQYIEDLSGNHIKIKGTEKLYEIPDGSNLHKAYVPKDTRYWINEFGEAVSETIVVSDEIVFPEKGHSPLNLIEIRDGSFVKVTHSFSELDGLENIAGCVPVRNPNSLYFVSMLKKDWTPRTFSAARRRKPLEKTSRDFFSLTPDLSTYYKIAETLGLNVDWSVYALDSFDCYCRFESPYGMGDMEENNYKGYCVPCYRPNLDAS